MGNTRFRSMTGTAVRSVLVALICVAATGLLAASTAQISTSQNQYSVGQGMVLNGTGFTPNAIITVNVSRPDGLTDTISPPVVTGNSGAFTVTYTPPLEPGRYRFSATDGANTANTAATGADAIGYNKGVYNKGTTAFNDTTGKWTSGDAGSHYLEGQWSYYQYQVTGVGATIPDFDVFYDYFQSNTNAIFVDALSNFRACVDCTDHSDTSGPDQGMLSDGVPFPPFSVTNWVDAHTAISNINRIWNPGTDSCTNTVETANTTWQQAHCYHVSGATLKTLLGSSKFTTGTHTVTLYWMSHLAPTNVWSKGLEYNLGCSSSGQYALNLTQYASIVPNDDRVFGTDIYTSDTAGTNAAPCNSPGWNTAFQGVGFATGSSRHFNLSASAGSNGAITLPIPTVSAPQGQITVVKVTNPASAAGAVFGYTGDLGSFSLDTDPGTATPNSMTFTQLDGGGTYSVTESAMPTGWSFTSLACVSNSGTNTISTSGPTATITLDITGNPSVTCTYTNTASGNIIVRKITNPSGSAQSFAFTTTGSGYTGFNLTGGQSRDSGALIPGSYSVAETAVTGWDLTSATCDNGNSPSAITLAAGATVTCTFTNTQRGTIVVKKKTVPAGGSGFTFTGDAAGTIGDGGTITVGNLVPGTYTSTETAKTGWDLTNLSCTTDGSGSGATATFNLQAGETITCTFTNTQRGTIVVKKKTVPAGGTGFTFTGNAAGTIGDGGTISVGNLVPGTYTSTETAKTGWDLTNLSCTTDGSASGATATFNLHAGETITCIFTNTQRANLLVQKVTPHGTGTFGYTGSANFSLTTVTPGVPSLAYPFANQLPGTTFNVTETAYPAWTLTGLTCNLTVSGTGTSTAVIDVPGRNASVTLQAGDTVTCTFTNDLNPTLKIVKNLKGLSQAFGFTVTGPTPITTTLTPPDNGSANHGPDIISIGGPYNFSENTPLPAGYTLTDLVCTGYTGTGAAGALNSDGIPTSWNFNAKYGDAIVCTATNSGLLATRTQGFWATHTSLANNVWNGSSSIVGATPLGADANLCTTTPITASALPGGNELMGGFWSSVSQTSGKDKRSKIDQARMQMLQQYLAAVLNVHAFGSGSETMLATARTVYCANDANAIQNQIGILGNFNSSGDSVAFTPGASATTQTSKDQANIPFWDVTIR